MNGDAGKRRPGRHERTATAYRMGEEKVREARARDKQEAQQRKTRLTIAKAALAGLETQLHYLKRGAAKTAGVPLVMFVKGVWDEIAEMEHRAACAHIWTAIGALQRAERNKLLPDIAEHRDEMKRRVRRAYAKVKNGHI